MTGAANEQADAAPAIKDLSTAPPTCRAEIYDLLWVVSRRINSALDSLQIGDDFATARAMRLGGLEFNSAAGLLVVLEETKNREREHRQARDRQKVPA